MELSWSTFLLEIVNFLVLVWILKRFLYRPVLGVIARRRAAIDKQMADASALKADAEALRERYQGRVEEWNTERQKALEALNREIEQARTRRLEELQHALDAEREKAKAAAARQEADAARRAERTALEQGSRFAARLLGQAAGPETEQRLTDLAIEQLANLTPERVAELSNAGTLRPDTVTVTSAFELPEAQRLRLTDVLGKLLDSPPRCEFVEDPALVAGLRLTIGPWIVGLNVHDELQGFARLAHGG